VVVAVVVVVVVVVVVAMDRGQWVRALEMHPTVEYFFFKTRCRCRDSLKPRTSSSASTSIQPLPSMALTATMSPLPTPPSLSARRGGRAPKKFEAYAPFTRSAAYLRRTHKRARVRRIAVAVP